MKRKTLNIRSRSAMLLSEAMRRYLWLDNMKRDLDSKFLGLGSPSAYADAVKDGLIVPSFRTVALPRVNGWYKLTDLGKRIVKQMIRKGMYPKSCQDIGTYVPEKVVVYLPE